jgi:hypothetical protein
MAHKFSYDVFLSHNAKDKPRVRRLAERLRQAGLRVWFDDWNIRSGDIIALKVDEGLEQSRVLLLCISRTLASGWVALERSTAIHRDPSNEGRRFIPLLLADCDLPDTLRRYKNVDFREEAESAFEELLAVCRLELGEATPTSKPAPMKETPNKGKALAKPPEETPMAVLERKLRGHNGWVNSVSVSADGKWAPSGSDDNDPRNNTNGHETETGTAGSKYRNLHDSPTLARVARSGRRAACVPREAVLGVKLSVCAAEAYFNW